jgi:hypothetical protein
MYIWIRTERAAVAIIGIIKDQILKKLRIIFAFCVQNTEKPSVGKLFIAVF